MNHDVLIAQYRSTSRKALYGSLVLLIVVAGGLMWNAQRFQNIESAVDAQEKQLKLLSDEKARLEYTLHSLKDAPDGGVRAMAEKVPVSAVMHDFFIWIDVSSLSEKKILEVRYDFAEESYEGISSTIEETGFGAFFRGPLLQSGPICPGLTRVTINFEVARPKIIDFDLCAVVGLDAL